MTNEAAKRLLSRHPNVQQSQPSPNPQTGSTSQANSEQAAGTTVSGVSNNPNTFAQGTAPQSQTQTQQKKEEGSGLIGTIGGALKDAAGAVGSAAEDAFKWAKEKAAPAIGQAAKDTARFVEEKVAPAVSTAAKDTAEFATEKALPAIGKAAEAVADTVVPEETRIGTEEFLRSIGIVRDPQSNAYIVEGSGSAADIRNIIRELKKEREQARALAQRHALHVDPDVTINDASIAQRFGLPTDQLPLRIPISKIVSQNPQTAAKLQQIPPEARIFLRTPVEEKKVQPGYTVEQPPISEDAYWQDQLKQELEQYRRETDALNRHMDVPAYQYRLRQLFEEAMGKTKEAPPKNEQKKKVRPSSRRSKA